MKKPLKIRDYDDVIPVAELRANFEQSVKDTPRLNFNCDTSSPLIENDKFVGYEDNTTDDVWIGFAIGMRCYQRLVRAGKAP